MIVRHRAVQEFAEVFFVHISIFVLAADRAPVFAEDLFEAVDASGPGERGGGNFTVETSDGIFFAEFPAFGDGFYCACKL
jgi:hypothetical protein